MKAQLVIRKDRTQRKDLCALQLGVDSENLPHSR